MTNKTNERIAPLAPYLGGKFRLSKRIVAKIEQIPHKIYAEPFVGMGGILLRRTKIPKAEVINDINGDLVNLYRIVQRYPEELCRSIKFRLTARQEFERLRKIPPETLTDIERATRFLYLQSVAFGGKVSGQVFGVSIDRPARFNFVKCRNGFAPSPNDWRVLPLNEWILKSSSHATTQKTHCFILTRRIGGMKRTTAKASLQIGL